MNVDEQLLNGQSNRLRLDRLTVRIRPVQPSHPDESLKIKTKGSTNLTHTAKWIKCALCGQPR